MHRGACYDYEEVIWLHMVMIYKGAGRLGVGENDKNKCKSENIYLY